jgi:hypothetical protein
MAPATRAGAQPAPAASPPRQWKTEENERLRLFLPGISKRPRWRELKAEGLPDDFAGAFRKGDLFVETERWAQFIGGKYVTSDPEEQAELERIEREGLAAIYEDYGADLLRCQAHNYVTTNIKAWEAHLRTHHKPGSAPALTDAAQDDLGIDEDTPY